MAPGSDGGGDRRHDNHNGGDPLRRAQAQGARPGPDGEPPVLLKGSFYSIRDGRLDLVMEDRTKRGLAVRERSRDGRLHGVMADKGMIHDMDGIGHLVPIRWYFPKDSYDLRRVAAHADALERRYAELRALTCPD